MYIHAFVSSTCSNQEFKCSNDDLFDPFAFGNPCGHFSTIVCRVRLVGPACGLLREGICSICYCWCSSMASGFIEWRAHPANSTPNLLYNRWHFHTAGCFANCVWSHYNFLMCVFACIWKLIYINWYIYMIYIYICVIIYIHVYLDTWTSSCATPINFYKKDPKVHFSVKSSKVMLTEVPMDVPVEDACSSDSVG